MVRCQNDSQHKGQQAWLLRDQRPCVKGGGSPTLKVALWPHVHRAYSSGRTTHPISNFLKISCQVPHGYIVQTALPSRNTIGPAGLSVKGSAAQVSWCTDHSPLKRILGQCSKKKLPAQGEGLTPSFISKTEIQANLSPNAICAQVCKHCLWGFTTLGSGSSFWFLRWSQPWQTASPTVIHHVPD